MKKILCPSMMCADYGNLRKEIEELESAGIDIFHVDIMDGKFVPNFGMGLQDLEYLCKHATKPVDVHLMIENPGNYIDKFAGLGVEVVYIHPESDTHPMRTLQKIKDCGMRVGIAVNPGTAVEVIEPLLDITEFVLVMTVNPGFAGQQYIESVNRKIERLLALREMYHFEIAIDGACAPERLQELNQKGVQGFILGTSALFGKGRSYKEIIAELRAL